LSALSSTPSSASRTRTWASSIRRRGGPSRYSLYTHGRVTNLVNAFSDLIWYLFIPPIEALAAAEGINFFYPHLVNPSGGPTTLGAIVGAILLLIFLPFNYYGINMFRNSTNLLGGVKLLIDLLVGVGFLTLGRFGNFSVHGVGFLPFGVSGVFAAVSLAMFSFGGIRVLPDHAEETTVPRQIHRGIVATVIGQAVVYVLFAIAFVAALNWTAFGLKTGAWTSVTKLPGNPFLAMAGKQNRGWLLVLTAIIAILGPFVTGYIYEGGRKPGHAGDGAERRAQRYGKNRLRAVPDSRPGSHPLHRRRHHRRLHRGAAPAHLSPHRRRRGRRLHRLRRQPNPVAVVALARQGSRGRAHSGGVVALLAFAAASLIAYQSGWPSVPYAVAILAVLSLVFGIGYKVGANFKHAVWYLVWILFIVAMTYVGSVGNLTLIPFG